MEDQAHHLIITQAAKHHRPDAPPEPRGKGKHFVVLGPRLKCKNCENENLVHTLNSTAYTCLREDPQKRLLMMDGWRKGWREGGREE